MAFAAIAAQLVLAPLFRCCASGRLGLNLRPLHSDGSASTWTKTVGLFRESFLHRDARYCHYVRGRLSIGFLKQTVSFQHPDSGDRCRN